MTCCQVSKHGVSGDETGEQTGNKLKMDFSCFFSSFFRALQFVLAHSAILIIPFGC